MEEIAAWQSSQLEPCYSIVFMEATRRSDGAISNKEVFVALAVLPAAGGMCWGCGFRRMRGRSFGPRS
ncbi:putative transposase [Acidocella aminolytica 101 = DSM 11237]|nr:hypothetical protein AA11237_3278 [Acidocella aminolytica 101 = DSM 11237]SHF53372.1 putative transposase [Acidocella aminolytica 101 = DSM 11237]